MNSPRNIIAIDRVPVSSLLGFMRINSKNVKVDSNTPWQSLHIKVPARLTISDKIEDGTRLYTAKLEFRTCEDASDNGRWAYRCHTADGRELLIGSPTRPYPVATISTNHPDNMTDNQLSEVAVNWTDSREISYIIR